MKKLISLIPMNLLKNLPIGFQFFKKPDKKRISKAAPIKKVVEMGFYGSKSCTPFQHYKPVSKIINL
jgi:hypothetical protein